MFECDPSKDRSHEYWQDGVMFGAVIGFAVGLFLPFVLGWVQ